VERLKAVVLDRLILYYQYLVDLMARRPVATITSAQIGSALGVDPSQVRKEFAAVGLMGLSRVGYEVCEVCRAIRTTLGFDHIYTGVVVGTGKLGGAILAYPDFARYGLSIVAAFDNDPSKVGRYIAGHRIRHVTELSEYVRLHRTPLAILTTPTAVADELARVLVSAGIGALWNFTPAQLTVPEGVLLRNERFSSSLAVIAYHLNQPQWRRKPAEGTLPFSPPSRCATAGSGKKHGGSPTP